jgi:hypothetical protein
MTNRADKGLIDGGFGRGRGAGGVMIVAGGCARARGALWEGPESGVRGARRRSEGRPTAMEAIPLRAFLDLLTLGLVRPRAAARRVLDARPGALDRVALVALAAALQGLLWTLAGLVAPSLFGGALAGGIGLSGHVALAAVLVANFALTTLGAYAIGRRLGGAGALPEVASAVAWHSVLGAALTPLQAMAFLGGGAPGAPPPGGAMTGASALSVMLYGGLNLWLLAACVAEAHGFRSTARVAGVTLAAFLAVGLGFGLILSLLAA